MDPFDNDEEIIKIRNERRKHMFDPPTSQSGSSPAAGDVGLFGDDDAALIGDINKIAGELQSAPHEVSKPDNFTNDLNDCDSTPMQLPTDQFINIENVQTLNIYVTSATQG